MVSSGTAHRPATGPSATGPLFTALSSSRSAASNSRVHEVLRKDIKQAESSSQYWLMIADRRYNSAHGRQLIAPPDRDKLFGFWLSDRPAGYSIVTQEDMGIRKWVVNLYGNGTQSGEVGVGNQKKWEESANLVKIFPTRSSFASLSMRFTSLLCLLAIGIWSIEYPSFRRLSFCHPSWSTICHLTVVDDDAKKKKYIGKTLFYLHLMSWHSIRGHISGRTVFWWLDGMLCVLVTKRLSLILIIPND